MKQIVMDGWPASRKRLLREQIHAAVFLVYLLNLPLRTPIYYTLRSITASGSYYVLLKLFFFVRVALARSIHIFNGCNFFLQLLDNCSYAHCVLSHEIQFDGLNLPKKKACPKKICPLKFSRFKEIRLICICGLVYI